MAQGAGRKLGLHMSAGSLQGACLLRVYSKFHPHRLTDHDGHLRQCGQQMMQGRDIPDAGDRVAGKQPDHPIPQDAGQGDAVRARRRLIIHQALDPSAQ